MSATATITRILATERIAELSDISAEWKIAAVESYDTEGNRLGWGWYASSYPVQDQIMQGIHPLVPGVVPRFSAVQGRQFVDGWEVLCLYVRNHPDWKAEA